MIALLTVVRDVAWSGSPDEDLLGFRDAAEILRAMRRRIDSGDATSDDQRRYAVASTTLERLSRHYANERQWPTLAVAADALDDLLGDAESVWSPDRVSEIVLEREGRLATIDASHPLRALVLHAAREGAGIVISVQPASAHPVHELPRFRPRQARSGAVAEQPELAEAVSALHAAIPLPFGQEVGRAADQRRLQATALRGQIVSGLRSGQVVPIGMAAPHDVIVEVLRELQSPDLPRGAVRLVHVDGSEGEPFPIGGAKRDDAPQPADRVSIRLGLMSIRHMDSDADVAGYWFRNRLVSVNERTLADTEAFCFRDTLERLPELSAVNAPSPPYEQCATFSWTTCRCGSARGRWQWWTETVCGSGYTTLCSHSR